MCTPEYLSLFSLNVSWYFLGVGGWGGLDYLEKVNGDSPVKEKRSVKLFLLKWSIYYKEIMNKR